MIEIASKHPTGADYSLVPDARKAIELFMDRLTDAALPEISRILLYGSRARGDNQVDSDIDIAVVLAGSDPGDNTQFKLLMRLADIRSGIMLEMDRPMDVAAMIVWENELLEPDKQYNPQFYRNVLADGIEIKAGLIDADLGQLLSRIEEARLMADYTDKLVDAAMGNEIFEMADQFVSGIDSDLTRMMAKVDG